MGHFGPQGCNLVLDAISRTGRPGLRLCELGSGFGGALRYLAGGLTERGLPVEWAVGIELVHEHCLSGQRIGGSIGHGHPLVCADVAILPIHGASVDYVVATGSIPHFPDMAKVLQEAVRILRPGGRIIMTEEVSLTREADEEFSSEFHLTHPSDVFFTASLAERRAQLDDAGLVDVEEHDLLPWASELLRSRLKALRIFRGSVEAIYGAPQTELIVRSLRATLALYEDGTLLPRMFLARRGPF
ncbi:methyltransferase domain-containing protein [Nonomuraea sp. NPDC046802]|uniref:class I SAM-dependent methyltransferase n=1 Tax=Nonomuraea sp. NPDC046802 TaxID=3154919 RepID=UPI0033F59510